LSPQLARAGEWFLSSGIQESSGGVARYHRVDIERNLPVSTEITGYALSTLVYLHRVSKDERYVNAARLAARFLTRDAWDATVGVMPFEIAPATHSYFFDCGIIVRGLLAAWHAFREQEFLDTGESMMRDFVSAEGDYHPILALPSKTPIERNPIRWSRSAGCYQLKAAMAWWDLFETTGDARFRAPLECVLEDSLATYSDFLPGHPDRHKVMDRLHAFCYFLEGLLPCAGDPRCTAALTEGIDMVAHYLRDIAPEFARSDVFAQLLRARLYASWCGAVPLNRACAEWEAAQLATFQNADGGYWFGVVGGGAQTGAKAGERLPFLNPVSTAFAAQALELWKGDRAPRHLLI
jgi:hypothetical protein